MANDKLAVPQPIQRIVSLAKELKTVQRTISRALELGLSETECRDLSVVVISHKAKFSDAVNIVAALVAENVDLEEAHTAVEICLEGHDCGIGYKRMVEVYLQFRGLDQDAIHEEIERLEVVATQGKQQWAGRKPGRGASRTRRAMGNGEPVPNIYISEPEE